MGANGRNRESGWMSPASTWRSYSLSTTTDRDWNQAYAAGVRNEDGALVWLTTARRKLSSSSGPTGNWDEVRGDVVFEVVPCQLWIASNNIGVKCSSGGDRLETKISTLPMAGGLAGGGVKSSGPEEREPGNIAGKAGGVDGLTKLLD